MLKIDEEKQMICLTRGDTASILFSAIDEDGSLWNPSYDTDRITFAVAKKWGGTNLMEISQTYGDFYDDELYKEVSVGADSFNKHKTWFYTKSDDEYIQCTANSVYDNEETYYMRDCDDFWTITIKRDDWLDGNGNDKFKFSDYVFDVQISTELFGDDTIIGQTDEITPTFRVWGEAAEE